VDHFLGGTSTWKIVFNGTDPNDGTVFVNWTFIQASEAADGNSGNMKIYMENSTEVVSEMNWYTDSATVYHFELYSYGIGGYKLLININPDNSGFLEMYDFYENQYVLTTKIIWTAAGTG